MLDAEKVRRMSRRAGFQTFYQLAQGFEAKGYSCSESQAKRFWNGDTDPKLSSLERLCEVLRCRLDDLVSKNGHTKTAPQKQAVSRNGKKR